MFIPEGPGTGLGVPDGIQLSKIMYLKIHSGLYKNKGNINEESIKLYHIN